MNNLSAVLPGRFTAFNLSLLPVAAALAVCLAAPPAAPARDTNATPKYNFFPPPPDDPHLQFLVSFNSEKELRGGRSGSLLTFITGQRPPEKLLGKPYGAVLSEKKAYVCDTAYHEVLKLDLASRRISSVDSTGPGAFKLPVNIAIDADGICYVADSGREDVVVLDRNENLITTIGDKTMNPRDVAVDAGRLYIGDVKNHCVHVLERATRKPLLDIPRAEDATNNEHKLYQPANIAVDGKGRVYASDVGADHIQVYDVDGKYLRTVGQYGDNAGEFTRPKGIALDRENRLYAVDAAAQVVQLFDDQGRLLMWFGDPRSSKVGLELPAKVMVDYDHVSLFERYAAPNFQVEYLVVVTSQYGPRKLSIFGFGHKK